MPQGILYDNSRLGCKGAQTVRCPVGLGHQAITWTKFCQIQQIIHITWPNICISVANASEIPKFSAKPVSKCRYMLTSFLFPLIHLTPGIWQDFHFCKLASTLWPKVRQCHTYEIVMRSRSIADCMKSTWYNANFIQGTERKITRNP